MAGIDGPEFFVNGEGRFVRGTVTGLVEAAGEGISVLDILRPVVFVMVGGHFEFGVVHFSECALTSGARPVNCFFAVGVVWVGAVGPAANSDARKS